MGRGAKELEQLKHLSTKILESTTNVMITKKNEKQYIRLQLSIPGTQGAFLDKVAPDIDDLGQETLVSRNVGENFHQGWPQNLFKWI